MNEVIEPNLVQQLIDKYFIIWLTLGLILAILVISDRALEWLYHKRKGDKKK